MDFQDARRILRGLELPRDGFEDVLAKLGTKGTPAVQPRSPNRTPTKTAKAKGSRAA